MSRFFLGFPPSGETVETDFENFISLTKGTTVISLADSEKFLELGLSENLQIRVENVEPGAPFVSVYSTLNEDEVPPVRLRLVHEDEEASAALIERRLRNIRQLYALSVLIHTDRGQEAASALGKEQNFDLEDLLPENERLFIQAAAPGSFWVTAYTKLKGKGQEVLTGLSLIYDEGRELLLRRARAKTKSDELDAELKRFELNRKKMNEMIELSDKIEKMDNKKDRKLLREKFRRSLSDAAPNSVGLLPKPNDDNA